MGDLSNTTINGVSYDFKDAGAARQSHSHTKSQITDFPTSMPASDVPAWAKASSKPSYTQDEVGDGTTYKRVTSTEKNTWNNKGTYSKPSGGIPKTDLASAVQTSLGLADGSLQHTTVNGSPDLDTFTTTGIYHIATQTATHAPTTNHATLFVDATVGTPYQIFKPDTGDTTWYTRHRSGSSWTAWVAMKFTDTTYSNATTSAAGLMSADDKTKLNGIATGAQVNSITGVKGNSESTYRTGNVNLTPANIGAAAASDVSVTASIALSTFATTGIMNFTYCSSCINKHGRHISGFIWCERYSSTPSARSTLLTINSGYRPSQTTRCVFIPSSYNAVPSEGPLDTSGVLRAPSSMDSDYPIIILFDYFTA